MSGNDKSDSGTRSFPITDPLLIQKLVKEMKEGR